MDDAGGSEWKNQSRAMRDSLEAPAYGTPGSDPWTATARLVGVPRSARVLDLIDICYFFHDGDTAGLFLDYTQALERRPWTRNKTRAWGTKTSVYSFDNDAVMDSTATTAIHGLPSTFKHSTVSQSELRNLAGESVFLPNMATVILGFLQKPMQNVYQTTAKCKSA